MVTQVTQVCLHNMSQYNMSWSQQNEAKKKKHVPSHAMYFFKDVKNIKDKHFLSF